ncbi:MAG: AMP-binding protein, partial [Polyangia bacterium]
MRSAVAPRAITGTDGAAAGVTGVASRAVCTPTRRATKSQRREFAAALDHAGADELRRLPVTIAVSRGRKLDRVCGGLRLRSEIPVRAACPYDLALTIAEDRGDLELHVTFASGSFDASTIDRWSDYLIAGLARAAAEPTSPIDRLDLLPAGEREWLVHGVNATATPYPSATSLHRLFEAEAAARPHATALCGGGREWSYASLNDEANRLARHLAAVGVGPDALVASFLDRSPQLVIALLAIAKAGAAYLPIDPSDPSERVRLMLEDAGTPPLV